MDFRSMTDDDFNSAMNEADNATWSAYANFAQVVMGYDIIYDGEVIPKYQIYHKYKYYPSQLRKITEGNHPDFRLAPNKNFDESKWKQLELGLPPATETMF